MVEVEGLVKRFHTPEGVVEAVNGVSFQATPGMVFGLLGPNGAGKTTTLRMLVTLLVPDEGTARLCGHDVRTDPAAVRASIGYLSSSTGLYGRLTSREMLIYFGRLQGVDRAPERADALIEQLELGDFAHRRCDRLSTGQKQRVNIARALVHDPPVLILDEPTAGLDVIAAQTLLRFIEAARDQGRCVLFSTHIMSEAERLCDQIAIIHRGRVLAAGTLPELRVATGEHYLESIFLKLVEGPEGSPA